MGRMKLSQYIIEPHGVWLGSWREVDIVLARNDLDALKQARQRCTSGALYRYTHRLQHSYGLVYVANFFDWELR
jgi:hypothetical protein